MTIDVSRRVRWIVLVSVVAVLIGGGVAVAIWATRDDSSSSVSQADCALVEDVGHQWYAMEAAVRQVLEQGAGESSDYLAAAEYEATMAETLRKASGSASSQEIKNQLQTWADGAALFAQTQRDVAEREPGTPPAPNVESDFIRAATKANDASIVLVELCPNMPSEKS
ncbi:hypothetical protein [Mycolicibacterium sp. 624]|uniref:hypothetical protein n=1 Tax=Mycolicibacterium sp. 624 TaxID=3156314 RepID=UPI0033978388